MGSYPVWPTLNTIYKFCVGISFIEQLIVGTFMLFFIVRLFRLQYYTICSFVFAFSLFILTDAFEKLFRLVILLQFPESFSNSSFTIYMTFSRVAMVTTGFVLLCLIYYCFFKIPDKQVRNTMNAMKIGTH